MNSYIILMYMLMDFLVTVGNPLLPQYSVGEEQIKSESSGGGTYVVTRM